MSRKNLNTLAIEDFLQNVKIASKKQTRELKLDQKQYKDLADSISMVLARLVELQDSKPTEQEAISIQMDGGKL